MYDIVFIAKYPKESELKDGMLQRIWNIDIKFKKYKRVYLEISYKKNLKKTIIEKENLTIIKLNYFLHKSVIKEYLKKGKKIYIHSIYNFKKIDKTIYKRQNVFLDVHGSVPEELEFLGRKKLARYMEKVEKKAFEYVDNIIVVTQAMGDYYNKKYNFDKAITYPIISNNVFSSICNTNKLKKELNIKENDTIFIYSGNCQKWQNVDIMLEYINRNKNNNYKFIILTGEKIKFDELIIEKNNNIILRSVKPEELSSYYELANYGFVLRDEHILNKVACPTKLFEYLYYGIIPIVKYDEIGDFKNLGYEYIKYDELNNNMKSLKSKKNSEICKGLIEKYRSIDLVNLLKVGESNE